MNLTTKGCGPATTTTGVTLGQHRKAVFHGDPLVFCPKSSKILKREIPPGPRFYYYVWSFLFCSIVASPNRSPEGQVADTMRDQERIEMSWQRLLNVVSKNRLPEEWKERSDYPNLVMNYLISQVTEKRDWDGRLDRKTWSVKTHTMSPCHVESPLSSVNARHSPYISTCFYPAYSRQLSVIPDDAKSNLRRHIQRHPRITIMSHTATCPSFQSVSLFKVWINQNVNANLTLSIHNHCIPLLVRTLLREM